MKAARALVKAAGVEAYRRRSMFHGENWHGRCGVCKVVLTKYDETAAEALRNARSAKAKGECRCGC